MTSVHYEIAQVAEGAWAAIATEAGAGVGNAGFADLGYLETVLALAAEPGDHEIPAAFADWGFAEGFERNIAALRAR